MAIRKGYVDVTDGQLHYRTIAGKSDTPIVFLHMTASTSESYDLLLEQIDGSVPAVAFDTPNYGESYRTDKSPSIPYIAGVMIEALDALGIAQFHAVGHHTGASIATELAVRHPDRVLSATLSGLVYATPEENAFLYQARCVDMPVSNQGEQLLWTWHRIAKYDTGPMPADFVTREVADTLKAGPKWHWAYRAVFTYDAVAALKSVTCPVFMVCAERDPVMPYYQRAKADLPDLRYYTAPGHGLGYFETGAADFAPHLLDFVTSIPR